MKTKNRKGIGHGINYWIFVGPFLLSFLLFYLLPVVVGLSYSLYDWNGISNAKVFVGLKNYVNLFTRDKDYWNSIGFTFKFAFFNVILSNVLSLLMALWVTQKLRTSRFLRMSFFLPNVLCGTIIGFLWIFIFNQLLPEVGKVLGMSFLTKRLLGSMSTAWIAVLIVSLWQGCGYNMIIYIAGLVSIDRTYYESAAIDGAGRIKTFFTITLPLLMPSITITLFNTIGGSFRMFDLNLTLTNGGPGKSTQGLALDVYLTAFSENRMGYGQAKGVILLILVCTIALLQTSFTRRREVQL